MIKYIVLSLIALVVMGCSAGDLEPSHKPATAPKSNYFNLGDTIPVNYWKVSINKLYETKKISSPPYTAHEAEKGAKYIFIKLEVENTAKQSMDFNPDDFMRLIDSKGNEFEAWGDSPMAYPDVLYFMDFDPSLPKAGYLIYKIPEKNTVKTIKFFDKSGEKLLKL